MEIGKMPPAESLITSETLSNQIIRHLVFQQVEHVYGEGDLGKTLANAVYHRVLWVIYPPSKLDIAEDFINSRNQTTIAGRITSPDIIIDGIPDLIINLVGREGNALRDTNGSRINVDVKRKLKGSAYAKILTLGGILPVGQLVENQLAYVNSRNNVTEVDPGMPPDDLALTWNFLSKIQHLKKVHPAVMQELLSNLKIAPDHMPEMVKSIYDNFQHRDIETLIANCVRLNNEMAPYLDPTQLSVLDTSVLNDVALYQLTPRLRRKLVAAGIGYEELKDVSYNRINSIHGIPGHWKTEMYRLLQKMGLSRAPLTLYLQNYEIKNNI